MDRGLRSGEWICKNLGVTAMDLARASDAGALVAYSSKEYTPIKSHHQCVARFRYRAQPLCFYIQPSYPYATMAIRTSCLKNFKIFIKNVDIDKNIAPDRDQNQHNARNTGCFLEKLVQASDENRCLLAERIEKNTFSYKNQKYTFFTRATIDDISFEIISENNDINFECLFFMKTDKYMKKPIRWSTNIILENRTALGEQRKVAYKYDDRIFFFAGFNKVKFEETCFCNYIPPNQERYKKTLKMMEIYQSQAGVDYYEEEGNTKLVYEKDFFIFDISEYYRFFSNTDSYVRFVYNEFCRIIFNMLFEVCAVQGLSVCDIEIPLIERDPKKYILNTIEMLILSSKVNDKESETLAVYKNKICGALNVDILKEIRPYIRSDYVENRRGDVSKIINNCPKVFKKFKIPFIPWAEMMKLQNREEIIDSMVRQMKELHQQQATPGSNVGARK